MNIQEIVCKSRLNITFKNEDYYWITKSELSIGGQTCFTGFTENKKEIRTLIEVNPDKAIKMCSNRSEAPMIINILEEAFAFDIVGGNAIVL